MGLGTPLICQVVRAANDSGIDVEVQRWTVVKAVKPPGYASGPLLVAEDEGSLRFSRARE